MITEHRSHPTTIKRCYQMLLKLAGIGLLATFAACEKQQTMDDYLAGLTDEQRRALQPMMNTPFFVDGIDHPEFTSSDSTRVQDDEQVIGVVVNERPRAYPISRLRSITDHVVNDFAIKKEGEFAPFTVTYCDKTDCIRVFEPTEEMNKDSLGISTYGLRDGGLAIEWNGMPYKQSGEIEGLRAMEYERTTWGEWKAKHPTTVVFKGRSHGK